MLEVKGIFKNYEDKVIGPLDLAIDHNQTVAIIGKSGSGKSTLIKLITGVLSKDGGEIVFDNNEVTKNDFTYISQIGTLFNHLTVRDNLYLTYNGEEEEVIKTLEEVNLDKSFLDKYPFELSGGERQRIDLTRAIIARTKIIILDESLSALDPSTKDDIYEVLKSLRERYELIIIIITHDLDEAMYLSDKIVILEDGKIVFNDISINLLKSDNHYIDRLISSHRLSRLRKVYKDV